MVRSLYAYDVDAVSEATGLVCKDKSLTVQDQAEEADINVLVERFGVTGQIPQKVRMPTYGDFTGVNNYQDALNAIMEAERSFMQLPAKVRQRFNNDPQEFLDFCEDPANLEEAQKLGLVKESRNGNVGEARETAGSSSSSSAGSAGGDGGAAGGGA